MEAIERFEARLLKGRGAQEAKRGEIEELKWDLRRLSIEIKTTEKAQLIIKKAAQDTYGELRYAISELVTFSLHSVFDEAYEFKVKFKERGVGRIDLKFILEKDGEPFDIFLNSGGGVADIISISLRVSIWCLEPNAPIMILDEPFRNLSDSHKIRAAKCLNDISREVGIQFIVVTHDKERFIKYADKIFFVEKAVGRKFSHLIKYLNPFKGG